MFGHFHWAAGGKGEAGERGKKRTGNREGWPKIVKNEVSAKTI